VDVWSLGVITYMLLTGEMFINERTEAQTKAKICNEYSVDKRMKDKCAKHISTDGKDFINLCFERNKKSRSSVAQLLEHTWITTVGGTGV